MSSGRLIDVSANLQRIPLLKEKWKLNIIKFCDPRGSYNLDLELLELIIRKWGSTIGKLSKLSS